MDSNTAAQLLGPRYAWAVNTVPVQKLIEHITLLEDKLCQCQPVVDVWPDGTPRPEER
jgi:hypothetical protein